MVSKSLINCHARGVDSVLFDDNAGSRIRLFIANEGHELWKNRFAGTEKLSTAFHPHHCDITLVHVYGSHLTNIQVDVIDDHPEFVSKRNHFLYTEFDYQSQITTGKCRFKEIATRNLRLLSETNLDEDNESVFLKSTDIHTIYVPKKCVCAWLVMEGKSNPNYKSLCYSNASLNKIKTTGMYKPMPKEYLLNTLSNIFGI